MRLPVLFRARRKWEPRRKDIGLWAQPDAVMIDVDHNRKPNKKITTSSAAGDVSRLASARSGSQAPCSPPTRRAGRHANDPLRHLAGNFYVNDESARWRTYSPICAG
jgi:hypothetical protein